MSKVFSARFVIVGCGPLVTPGDFDVFGDVIDASLDGYSVTDVAPYDIFFDENMLNGLHNRYRVLTVVATGPSAYSGGNLSSIHLTARYDDDGAYDSNGPAASQGIIGAATSLGTSEIPSWTMQGVSESLIARASNINMRRIVSPAVSSVALQKRMKNTSASTIAAGVAVSKMSDGGITASDSDVSTAMQFVGISAEAINSGSFGVVKLAWPNIAGIMLGRGFLSGSNVYMSETTGQFAGSASDFTLDNDRILRIGIADCSDSEQSSAAKDLLMFVQAIGKY